MAPRWPVVAVIGAGQADAPTCALARAVGALVVGAGASLVTGGRGGVMAAASQGAHAARAAARQPPILAILPGYDRAEANPWADLVLPTGLGHARNALVVAAADLVIVIGGEAGTLSELGLACKLGRPVCLLAGSGGVADRALDLLPAAPGLQRVPDLVALEARLAALIGSALVAAPDDEQAARQEGQGEGDQ